MGIKGCKRGNCKETKRKRRGAGSVLWTATGLKLKALKVIGTRIDVDGNALFCNLAPKCGSFHLPVEAMVDFLTDLGRHRDFAITVIVDGDKRPDCKRDSWSR